MPFDILVFVSVFYAINVSLKFSGFSLTFSSKGKLLHTLLSFILYQISTEFACICLSADCMRKQVSLTLHIYIVVFGIQKHQVFGKICLIAKKWLWNMLCAIQIQMYDRDCVLNIIQWYGLKYIRIVIHVWKLSLLCYSISHLSII